MNTYNIDNIIIRAPYIGDTKYLYDNDLTNYRNY